MVTLGVFHNCVVAFVFGCGGVAVACLQADNKLRAAGAKALAPELGKLTQLQTVNLSGDYCSVVWAALVLHRSFVSVVVVLYDLWMCATACLCCLHVLAVHRRNVAH